MSTANKLFHGLVVMGASLTGALGGCGGETTGVDAQAAHDAAADQASADRQTTDAVVAVADQGSDDLVAMDSPGVDSVAYATISPCPPNAPCDFPMDASAGDQDAQSDAQIHYGVIAPPGPK